MREDVIINELAIPKDNESYDAIREAIRKLSISSQEQFETIKKEKWYNRIFDMLTFSQKGKKRLAEQISTLSQAQQIFIELLLRLSSNDTRISQIVYESLDDIKKIQEQNIYLLSRIKKLEDISLGIKPDMDIKGLSDRNKKILSACLYFLNSNNLTASDDQKKYANVVMSYIGVDALMDNPTYALNNIDVESKKIILCSCMEFIFLKDYTDNSFDEYEDFIDEFDIGSKTIKSIKERIKIIYGTRGAEGLYSKYSLDQYDNLNDSFTVDIDDTQEDTNVDIDNTSNDTTIDIEDKLNDIELKESSHCEKPDEMISSMLSIAPGETKILENKNIHLSTDINCEGTIKFSHCIINYNEFPAHIKLSNGASVVIHDSKIICNDYNEAFFISCEGEKNSITINNTIFIDCSYFIGSRLDTFILNKCKMHNCYTNFVDLSVTTCDISDNEIIEDDISPFHLISTRNKKLWDPELFKISSRDVKFHNNIIREEASFRSVSNNSTINYLNSHVSDICNCTFIGLSSPITTTKIENCQFKSCTEALRLPHKYNKDDPYSLVYNCVFEDCENVIDGSKTIIKNCRFISCYNYIISGDYDGGISLESCEFYDSKFIHDPKNAYMDNFRGCINFSRSKDSNSKANYIKNCLFDGVEIVNAFFILASIYGKPSGTVAFIENCNFRNCSTHRVSGKIIKEKSQYNELFRKNISFNAIKVTNCNGLDNINVIN